jgi:hypothetical protein
LTSRGRAYVSPAFELAGPSTAGTPEPKVKLYEEKKALKGYTTQYEYATEYEKSISMMILPLRFSTMWSRISKKTSRKTKT